MAVTERDLSTQRRFTEEEIGAIRAAIYDTSRTANDKIKALASEFGRTDASVYAKYFAVKKALKTGRVKPEEELLLKHRTASETLTAVIETLTEVRDDIHVLEDFADNMIKVKQMYGYNINHDGTISDVKFR